MAITIDFSRKYANLRCEDLTIKQLSSQCEYCSDIPMIRENIPDKYRRPFIHPENGFVNLYCKAYDRPKGLIRRK